MSEDEARTVLTALRIIRDHGKRMGGETLQCAAMAVCYGTIVLSESYGPDNTDALIDTMDMNGVVFDAGVRAFGH